MSPIEWEVGIERPAGTALWSDALNETYHLWRRSWDREFQKFEPGYHHPSDAFSRQDEIIRLSFKGRVVAMVAHRFAYSSRADLSGDSFFSYWPQSVREEILSGNKRIVIGSQITVSSEARSSALGFDLKTLVSALSLHRVWAVSPDLVLGMMRTDKGMTKVFQRLGAQLLLGGIDYHGMTIDLVRFREQPQTNLLSGRERLLFDQLSRPLEAAAESVFGSRHPNINRRIA